MSVNHSTASIKELSPKNDSSREKMDITKLALCWALTLTTSTLLTVSVSSNPSSDGLKSVSICSWLVCCTLLSLSSHHIYLQTVGPLAAKEIGANDTLAPFTIGTFLIGAAASSVPSGKLFKAYGRYWGFAFGCACQLAGSALGAFAMISESLPLIFIGCFCVGMGQGLGQFYRFAAVEVASEDHKSKAVTFVLTGGVLAAFLGPTSANYTKDFFSDVYAGSFLSMGVIGLLNWAVVALVNFPETEASGDGVARVRKSRPLREICSTPIFILSCTVATIAHTVMVSLTR